MAKYGVAVYGVDTYGEASAPIEGGSTAVIAISATGSGQAIKQGGSTASIAVSATGNGVKIALNGSQADISISADGSGVKISSNGSESIIEVSADGNGIKIASSGSTALIEISAEGGGIVIVYYALISVGLNRSILMDRRVMSIQSTSVLFKIDLSDSLWTDIQNVRLDALLPNGIIESKGLYQYDSSPILITIGDDDTILKADGTLKLQVSSVNYANDGITEIVKKRSKVLTKNVVKAI